MRRIRLSPRWTLPILLALALALFLSACGGSSAPSQGSNSSGTQAATPTTAPITPADLTTYQAQHYTISYPKDWAKSVVGDNVTFTDTGAQKGYLAIAEISNPNDITPISAGITGSINGLKTTFPDNFTQEQIPNSTTINGITWSQGGIAGSSSANGKTRSIKAIVLGANHPDKTADTKLYLIIYTGDAASFDQMVGADFQPMLNSLKFTS
jgi:hypothetical protein